MNPYEKCKALEKVHDDFTRQMEEASKAWKKPLEELYEYQTKVYEEELPFDPKYFERLRVEAKEKYEEFIKIGQKRIDAFFTWVNCLNR